MHAPERTHRETRTSPRSSGGHPDRVSEFVGPTGSTVTHGTRAACLQGGRELGFVRVNVFYVAVNCEWAQVGVCVFVCVCVFVRACFCVCCWSFQQDRARPTRDTSYTRALHSSARINRQSLDLHISPSKQHGGGGCLLGETEWGGGGGGGTGVHENEIIHATLGAESEQRLGLFTAL